MVKDTVKKFYSLVDASSKEELTAALELLNAEVNEVEVVEEAKEAFGDATLADGETKIYFAGDDLTIGTALFADETLETPVGAGEWTLENGDVLLTDEAGLVLDLLPAGGEVEEDQSAQPTSIKETTTTETNFNEEVVEEVSEVKTQVEEIFEALQPLFDQINARFEALEGTSKENEELKEELSKTQAKVEKLAKQPAAELYTGKTKTNRDYTPKTIGYNSHKAKLGIK